MDQICWHTTIKAQTIPYFFFFKEHWFTRQKSWGYWFSICLQEYGVIYFPWIWWMSGMLLNAHTYSGRFPTQGKKKMTVRAFFYLFCCKGKCSTKRRNLEENEIQYTEFTKEMITVCLLQWIKYFCIQVFSPHSWSRRDGSHKCSFLIPQENSSSSNIFSHL